MDQGVLNILLARLRFNPNLVPLLDRVPFMIQPDGRGGMVHTMKYAQILQDSSGRILEDDGVTISAAVHQYDRHERLVNYSRRFAMSGDVDLTGPSV